ncbi:MAG TPA: methyltransferase domain-containing protein [Victivallales bacterium]|nr:methyltransferase domain-containing protein [Victivallales bacterium]
MKVKQYNKVAKDYSEYHSQDMQYRKDMYSLLPSLNGKSILDVGCGEGTDSKYFLESGASLVAGIDSSDKMLEIAKLKAPQANFSCVDISKQQWPFEDKCFDIVFSNYAINHIQKLNFIFDEVYRILKKNGIFLLCVTHPTRQFLSSKTKDYSRCSIVKIFYFDGKVSTDDYSHCVEDYLSESILANFELNRLKEGYCNDDKKFNSSWKYPCHLILKYKRK